MGLKYKQAYDGHWIKPVMEGYKVACCDCGLVHTLDFKVVGKEIEYRVTRDKRATAQKRRWKKLKQLKQSKASKLNAA